jgi:hypothetical protein
VLSLGGGKMARQAKKARKRMFKLKGGDSWLTPAPLQNDTVRISHIRILHVMVEWLKFYESS